MKLISCVGYLSIILHFESLSEFDILASSFIIRFVSEVTRILEAIQQGDSLTNAVLVPEEGLDETFAIHDAGTVRTQVWHYPSRSECLTCHTPIAGLALGFKTAQLNRDLEYGGSTQNQIRALSDAGYFSTNINGLHTLPAVTVPTNEAVSLDFRVRSYLAVNCVQCHQPGGTARGGFDTRLTTPLSLAGLVNGVLVDTSGSSDNRVIEPGSLDHSVLLTRVANLGPGHMPPLATSVVNSQALELLSAWITNGLAQSKVFLTGNWPTLDRSTRLMQRRIRIPMAMVR